TVTTGAEAASMKFRGFGFCAIFLAKGSAYSAYAPLNWSFVAPYTSSPSLNPETSAPIDSTIPDNSEPRIRGKGWSSILPSRIRASQLPTPAAFTRTNSCPAAGSGRGRSSFVITLGGPNRRTRAAFIFLLWAAGAFMLVGSPAQFRNRFRSLSKVNRAGSQNASKNAAAAAQKTQ